jgi:Lon protease-like protein
MHESLALPERVPVMPLPNALLFPHALLPLHIFESRYQRMLIEALNKHRMFCVALLKESQPDWESIDDFFHIAGVGLIRACVEQDDGTSNLILQGIRRVRLSEFQVSEPFPIAQIEPLESDGTESVETDALSAKVIELYSKLKENGRTLPPQVDQYLLEPGNTEVLADLMAATFVSSPFRRQKILEELAVNQRLRLLIKYLREETLHFP